MDNEKPSSDAWIGRTLILGAILAICVGYAWAREITPKGLAIVKHADGHTESIEGKVEFSKLAVCSLLAFAWGGGALFVLWGAAKYVFVAGRKTAGYKNPGDAK